MEEKRNEKIGGLYAAAAFLTWGFLPLYWKALKSVSALEILTHRIFWAFIFMLLFFAYRGKWAELKVVLKNRRKMGAIIVAAILVSLNWGIYIWAVNADHVVDTSLGYYINPLLSVCLGMLILKERLNFWQMISLLLAFVGVLIITFQYGKIPWISLSLAFSFGLYGLVKKMAGIESTIGLILETFVLMPLAFSYLTYLHFQGQSSFGSSPKITLLLVLAGVATAVPLLWFARATQMIPLSSVGFIQYLTPTIMLLIGVVLFGEPFTIIHLLGFTCIWLALALFSLSRLKRFQKYELKWLKKKRDGSHNIQ